MLTRTLFLDALVLTSLAFPSGFSGSLSSVFGFDTRRIDTAFLLLALMPFVIVALALLSVRPDLILPRSPHLWVLALALLAAPATLALEWCIQNAVAFMRWGTFRRGIELHAFWQGRRSAIQLGLLTLIALGEEFTFRQIWIGVLDNAFGFTALVALMTGAAMYGLNHLYFGWSSVLAKTAAGLVYGGLFLIDDGSLWSPFLAHALQNTILLGVASRTDG